MFQTYYTFNIYGLSIMYKVVCKMIERNEMDEIFSVNR